MRRHRLLFLVVSLALLLAGRGAAAQVTGAPGGAAAQDEVSRLLADQVARLDLGEVESYLQEVDRELRGDLAGFSLAGLLASLRRGEVEFDPGALFRALARCFFRELLAHTTLLGKLLVLGAVLAVLEQLQGAFEKSSVARLAQAVGVLGVFLVALAAFTRALELGKAAVANMVGFMHAILPVTGTLTVALGGASAVALTHPVILVALNFLGRLLDSVVFPLIFAGAVLGITAQVSERVQVSRFATLLRDATVILLGLFLTLFVGVLAVRGVAGAVADSVGLRAAKFLTGSFVPVVGKIMADAVEAVMGCSLFLKNAIGALGALALLFICGLPVLKMLAVAFVYRLAAAVLEPLGARQLGESLQILGGYLFLAFAAVAGVGLMFFISLALVVGLGNMVVLLG